MSDYSKSIQDLILQKKTLGSISNDELEEAFLSHMRKARHTDGDFIEFKFANLTFNEMQSRENKKSLKWSWTWGFLSALCGGLFVEIIKHYINLK